MAAPQTERFSELIMHRPTPRLPALRMTSVLAALFSFALVVWGAVVRINGAGMTCPDWPKCRGAWIPSLNDPVIYEFSHRIGAPLLTLLIVGTFILAFRSRRVLPEVMKFAWTALGFVIVQIIVGALTIRYANNPPSVAAHLVLGIATFTTLSLLAYTTFARAPWQSEGAVSAGIPMLGRIALLSAVLAFITIFAAGYMSASQAGLACLKFPLCNGWLPAQTFAQQLHMNHRIAAYATTAIVCMLALSGLSLRSTSRETRTLLWIALALVAAQVALGALTVLSGLAPGLRVVHEANGALLAAVLSLITYRSYRSPQTHEASAATAAQVVRNYFALSKPNVMSLLLFTTLTAMMIAAGGFPPWTLVLWTLLGGALAAASSASINMYLDRDIDAQMSRTKLRPIPSGKIKPAHALIFGMSAGILAFVELALTVNLLAAALSLSGILFYVLVYTMWLKRTTPQNIVIGGAAGSVPPLVGWAAVTHHLDLTALLLFLIIFMWTPPHFWSLALMKKDEYARVGIPMLPAVRGEAVTKQQIVLYSCLLVAVTLLMVPLRLMGGTYFVCALILDGLFLAGAFWVARAGTRKSEGVLYMFSMLYLALLFSAMVIDRFGRGA